MKKKLKRRVLSKRNKVVNIKKEEPQLEPIIKDDIKPKVRGRGKGKKLTKSKIYCVRCKAEKKTNKLQMEKLIGIFGSLEAVHEKFHCIKCRHEYNVRKDGRPLPEKRKRRNKETSEEPVVKPTIRTFKPIFKPGSLEHEMGLPILGKEICWNRPEQVPQEKWNAALKKVVEYGIKKGLLHRYNEV